MEHFHYLVTGALFREEQHVYAQVLEQQFVLRGKVAFVVYTGQDPLGADLLGQQGAHYVHALRLERIHGNEKIGLGAACLSKQGNGGRGTLDRGYIEFAYTLPILVYDGDFIGRVAQQLGKMRTNLSGAFNNNLHFLQK